MKQKIILLFSSLLAFAMCIFYSCDKILTDDWKELKHCPEQPYVDYMGKRYETVQIGKQCWFAKNLDVGSQIYKHDSTSANNGIIEKYCYDDDPENCNIYGALYKWDEIIQFNEQAQKNDICPIGWHVPFNSDWDTLLANFSDYPGRELKEFGFQHWKKYISHYTGKNTSGFTALPGGFQNASGSYDQLNLQGLYWSKNQNEYFLLEYDKYGVKKEIALLNEAYSVRCIKSNQMPTIELITEDSTNFFPLNGILQWSTSDMDKDVLWCNVYLGKKSQFNNLPVIEKNNDQNQINLSGKLEPGTIYHWQIEVSDGKDSVIGEIRTFVTERPGCPEYAEFYYEGKVYHSVEIGDQCWMRESLDVGTMISHPTQPGNNGIIEKYCLDNNPDNCEKYGALYNWGEMMNYSYEPGTQGICPSGWHIPTNDDWEYLESYLGENPGGKLMIFGSKYWESPNEFASNESGMGFFPNHSNKEYAEVFSSSFMFHHHFPDLVAIMNTLKLWCDETDIDYQSYDFDWLDYPLNCQVRCMKNNNNN